jgi:hypothetical protein
LAAAAALLASHPRARTLAGDCVVLVGARPEVDLDALRWHEAVTGGAGTVLTGPVCADALAGYWGQCQQLWQDLRAGTPSGAYVMTVRPLHRGQQKYTRGDKTDLVAEIAACESVPALAELVTALTAPEPDLSQLALMAAGFGGTADRKPSGQVWVTAAFTGATTWPTILGGVAWPGEVERTVTLVGKHATWRDRRVRRLLRVEVDVREVWPDPADWRAQLPVG